MAKFSKAKKDEEIIEEVVTTVEEPKTEEVKVEEVTKVEEKKEEAKKVEEVKVAPKAKVTKAQSLADFLF